MPNQTFRDGEWVEATPLPEPWAWRLWRFLRLPGWPRVHKRPTLEGYVPAAFEPPRVASQVEEEVMRWQARNALRAAMRTPHGTNGEPLPRTFCPGGRNYCECRALGRPEPALECIVANARRLDAEGWPGVSPERKETP